ncbi:MAG TPA: ABC transporter ATP-binding protein [Bryobacteraceae bacterium]|nr:ABC transporter ATP-binding protein [Bryobacteraceae bacterium]
MTTVIEFDRVSKSFPRVTGQQLLRTHIVRWFGSGGRQGEFFALKNVSFRLHEGESLAVVGRNGAGKSTLLGLAAGVATPKTGRVTRRGRVGALLELGSGFHPDLTGIENLVLNAALLGLSRKQTMERLDRVIEYSGVGEFINEPLRTYSSGMMMRLAFSIAIQSDPEILIIDEILGVGDAGFQEKCRQTLDSLIRSGKSLLFVSHSAPQVRGMCKRAIWLDHGAIMVDGNASEVLEAYEGRAVLKQSS